MDGALGLLPDLDLATSDLDEQGGRVRDRSGMDRDPKRQGGRVAIVAEPERGGTCGGPIGGPGPVGRGPLQRGAKDLRSADPVARAGQVDREVAVGQDGDPPPLRHRAARPEQRHPDRSRGVDRLPADQVEGDLSRLLGARGQPNGQQPNALGRLALGGLGRHRDDVAGADRLQLQPPGQANDQVEGLAVRRLVVELEPGLDLRPARVEAYGRPGVGAHQRRREVDPQGELERLIDEPIG